MKPLFIDTRKPIKLKIEPELKKDKELMSRDSSHDYESVIHEVESHVNEKTQIPYTLSVKVLNILKQSKISSRQKKSSSVFKKSRMPLMQDKQNLKVHDMSKSVILNKKFSNNGPQCNTEPKETLTGKIKLKKLVNNQKVEVGEAQEATVISSALIIRNLREKLNQSNKGRQDAKLTIEGLQRQIQQLEQQQQTNSCIFRQQKQTSLILSPQISQSSYGMQVELSPQPIQILLETVIEIKMEDSPQQIQTKQSEPTKYERISAENIQDQIIEQPKQKKSKLKFAVDENVELGWEKEREEGEKRYLKEELDSLKTMLTWQNMEIENLRNKLVTNKQPHRWNQY